MVELKGKYKGFEYVVTFDTSGAYRCGYVGIPENHKYYKKYYEDIPNIYCHGGLTFSDFSLKLGSDLWWIGFDCNHMDGFDIESLKKYCGSQAAEDFIHRNLFYEEHLNYHIYTLDDCIQECEDIIDQIII